jgi:uncharacterized RmlC-like cupin family protein
MASAGKEEPKLPEFRKNLDELKALKPTGGYGSSGEQGILEVTVMGDPDKAGTYVQLLRVPPHTKVAAHYHSSDWVATVLSGSWHFGFGDKFDESKLKHLLAGSIYTEPDRLPHFAMTDDTEAVVQLW